MRSGGCAEKELKHMKEFGIKTKRQKSVFFQYREPLILTWEPTTMQACMFPAQIESILMSVKSVREGRSLTVKQF